MDITLAVELVALVLLLGLSAFFSSSETSLFSLSSTQLQQMRRDRNPRLGLIEELLSEPRRLIATILIGNELVNVSASVLSATIVIDLFGAANSWLNVLIMVPLLLLFGEITPKTLALANNVKFATLQSRYLDLFARFISPLRKVVRAASEFFINLIVSGERSTGNILTEDMVRSLTKAAVGEGSLDSKESEYIHQIFDFGNKTVGDVMTVRSQIVSVDESMSLAQMLEVQRSTRRSKLPVFSEDGKTVLGVLFARDLLGLRAEQDADGRALVKSLLRKPYLVPESRMAADLFVAMRRRRSTLALVTDEFGGTIGLITLEDLLECIFGDLPSSSDAVHADSPALDALGKGLYRVSAAYPIRQFNEAVGTSFEAPGVTTLGGLVLHARGELPARNDVVTIDDTTFTVTGVDQQRILKLTVQVRPRALLKAGEEQASGAPDKAPDNKAQTPVHEPEPDAQAGSSQDDTVQDATPAGDDGPDAAPEPPAGEEAGRDRDPKPGKE